MNKYLTGTGAIDELDTSIKSKINTIATEMYGAKDVSYSEEAERQIEVITKQGFSGLPICMAKTHLSLSDNPKIKGAPTGELSSAIDQTFLLMIDICQDSPSPSSASRCPQELDSSTPL